MLIVCPHAGIADQALSLLMQSYHVLAVACALPDCMHCKLLATVASSKF